MYFWGEPSFVGLSKKEEADTVRQIPRADTGDGQRPLRRYAQIAMEAREATELDKRVMQNAGGFLASLLSTILQNVIR